MFYLNGDFSEYYEEKSIQKFEKKKQKIFLTLRSGQFRDLNGDFKGISMITFFFARQHLCT